MIARGTRQLIDHFDRAQALTTTPGMNGWTIKDTSSSGTPTYLCLTEDGGAIKLLLDNTSEEQIVTMYQNDVLMYDFAQIQSMWWIAKVSGVDAVTTICLGLASATNDTEDSVTNNAWFKIAGADSTSAIVVETDDNVLDLDDKATGATLSSTYKKLELDFTGGLANVRFNIDGAPVARGVTFDMSNITAGNNGQPFVRLHKASGTGIPAVQIAQFGVQYNWAYGV